MFIIDLFFIGNFIVNLVEVLSFYNFFWIDDQDFILDNNNLEEDDQDEVLFVVQFLFDFVFYKNVISYGFYEFGDLVIFEFEVANQGFIMVMSV